VRATWSGTDDAADVPSEAGVTAGLDRSIPQWWGERLVIDGRAVDPETGGATTVPWPADDTVQVVDQTWAVACDTTWACTAWDAVGRRLWTAELGGLPGADARPDGGTRWATVTAQDSAVRARPSVVDMATGRVTEVELGGGGDPVAAGDLPGDLTSWSAYLSPAADGWMATAFSPSASSSDLALQALTPAGHPRGPLIRVNGLDLSLRQGWTVSAGGPATAQDLVATIIGDRQDLLARAGAGGVSGLLGTAPCDSMRVNGRVTALPGELASWTGTRDELEFGIVDGSGSDDAEGSPSTDSDEPQPCGYVWADLAASDDASTVVGWFQPRENGPRMGAIDVRRGRFTWVSDVLFAGELARPDLVVGLTGDGDLVAYAPGP